MNGKKMFKTRLGVAGNDDYRGTCNLQWLSKGWQH